LAKIGGKFVFALVIASAVLEDLRMMNPLFPSLLGNTAWHTLPEPVRGMHGGAPRVKARGVADVDGDASLILRLFRAMLGLPSPGPQQALEFSIERNGSREVWTRCFAHGRMRSVLDLDANANRLLERLGPVTLHFELRHDGDGIDWNLLRVSLFGLPLPRAWFGEVLSRSYAQDGRYAFAIDTRLPLAGRLVAYRGWLEIVSDE
jgi:hypothetical protein